MLYEKQESLSLEEGYGIQLSTNSIKILNIIGFNKIDKSKIFHPTGVDFYDIENKKIKSLNTFKDTESFIIGLNDGKI